MLDLDLLMDLHVDGERQGPGSEAETLQALKLTGVDQNAPLQIADLGCGTGASTLVLAQALQNAQITAVDFLPPFLEKLQTRARERGVAEQITTLACSMEELPFAAGTYDLIWSEGAIYNMGFEKGVCELKRFLKPGGKLAVSEISWLSSSRPTEIQEFWEQNYAEMATPAGKLKVLEKHGYAPEGFFVLPADCWLENYYGPLQKRYDAFLARHNFSDAAQALVESDKAEVDLYQRFQKFYGYGFYIASRCP